MPFVFLLAIAIWPFVVVALAVGALPHAVARCVPGTRANFQAKLERGWRPDWLTIRRLWLKANALYLGPVGPCAEITPEYLALKFVWSHPDIVSRQDLRMAIGSSSTILDAYCIQALDDRNERHLLADLPPGVGESKRRFKLRNCCFGAECTLGEFLASRTSPSKSKFEGTGGDVW